MSEETESSLSSERQEEEMTEALLSFAKFAIQNAQAHLSTVELFDAVELLKQVERLIEGRLIEVAKPAEPGLIEPEEDAIDLRDM